MKTHSKYASMSRHQLEEAAHDRLVASMEYNGEEDVEETVVNTMVQSVQNYYMIYLVLGLSIALLVILIMKFIFNRRNKKKQLE